MKFTEETSLTQILDALFTTYVERVPDVRKITQGMIRAGMVKSQTEIINDHIAFRTMGVPNLGIASFEKIFLAHGYTKKDFYHFEAKKLDAYWYAPPREDLPRIFISELKVNLLSPEVQQIIYKYTHTVSSDPVDRLDLNNSKEVAAFFKTPLWSLPAL